MSHSELEKCQRYIASYKSLKTIASQLGFHVDDAYGQIYIIPNKYKKNLYGILEAESGNNAQHEYGAISFKSIDEMKIFLFGVAMAKNKIIERKYNGEYNLCPIKQYKASK